MIRTAGPSLRAATRVCRQNAQFSSRNPAARSYASIPPPNQHTITSPSNTGRNLVIAGLTFGSLGLGIYYFQSRGGIELRMLPVPMAAGTKPTSEGVLNSKSLKEPGLHAADQDQDHLKAPGLDMRHSEWTAERTSSLTNNARPMPKTLLSRNHQKPTFRDGRNIEPRR